MRQGRLAGNPARYLTAPRGVQVRGHAGAGGFPQRVQPVRGPPRRADAAAAPYARPRRAAQGPLTRGASEPGQHRRAADRCADSCAPGAHGACRSTAASGGDAARGAVVWMRAGRNRQWWVRRCSRWSDRAARWSAGPLIWVSAGFVADGTAAAAWTGGRGDRRGPPGRVLIACRRGRRARGAVVRQESRADRETGLRAPPRNPAGCGPRTHRRRTGMS